MEVGFAGFGTEDGGLSDQDSQFFGRELSIRDQSAQKGVRIEPSRGLQRAGAMSAAPAVAHGERLDVLLMAGQFEGEREVRFGLE